MSFAVLICWIIDFEVERWVIISMMVYIGMLTLL